MNRKLTLLTFASLIMFVFFAISFTSCTKEGPEGKPGLDGMDGAQSCGECHNMSEFLKVRVDQYAHSVHASGANIDRTLQECAWCHTSMGFRNYLADGIKGAISDPTPINCRTCHPIHETYSTDDYELRTISAVALMVGDTDYDFGASNLCANCHQARPVSPYPVEGGPDITITNYRYGPHYGTQSNMFAGVGPYLVSGSMTYINSAHTRLLTDGCVTCHMSPATGNRAGGHQMNIKYTTATGLTAYQYTGCLASNCHSTAEVVTALINPNRNEIKNLIAQLKVRLQEKGLLNDFDLVPVPKTMTQMEAAAIMNFKFVYGDQSYGAHNYRFTKALLVNTLESIE